MRIITERTQIREVSKRWDRQYPQESAAHDKRVIGDCLRRLDLETATADEVAAIIGNRTWAEHSTCECDPCRIPPDDASDCCFDYHRKTHAIVVEVGEPPGYDSRTVRMCLSCARAALAMIEAAHKTEGARP